MDMLLDILKNYVFNIGVWGVLCGTVLFMMWIGSLMNFVSRSAFLKTAIAAVSVLIAVGVVGSWLP